MSDLKKLRSKLSEIDLKIIDLIHQRQALSQDIGILKRTKGKPTRDYKREKEVIELAKEHASKLNIESEMIVDLMQLLIKSSLKTQEKARVKEEGLGSGQKVLVIGGCGRMGNWFVEFLTSQGYTVEIADPSQERSSDNSFQDWKDADDNYDMTVIAAPLRESVTILSDMLETGRKGIVFDIGSLKSPVKDLLKRMAEKGIQVASIHPMFGPDADLLTGKHIIFMNIDSNKTLSKVRQLFESTTAQLIEMSIDSHDFAISYVLGLSHTLNIAFAKVLASSGENKDLLSELSSTTFKDQLSVAKRVTDENPHLYYEIQYMNKHSLKMINELSTVIENISQYIEQGDEDAFVAMMEDGKSYFSVK
jgi:chorismate mutase/prephenate dehydrogenase